MKLTIILFTIILLLLPSTVSASVDPFYKECMQRGYQVEDINDNVEGIAYCVFPDNTKCPIEDFNSANCGQAFMTQNYCVKQGMMVWDKDKCCQGLKPYLPFGAKGQKTCQPIIKANLIYIIGSIIIVIVGFLIYFFMKKRK